MNVMKFALLGTAALAAVTVSARADDLSDLKAQIEALNGRIAQLETAPAVPAGYQLLTVSESKAIIVPSLDIDASYGDTATNIGILPTADVPASTNIQWSGFVRAALAYYDNDEFYTWTDTVAGVITDQRDESSKGVEIYARGEIKVVGTTDTAVGEVGALVKVRGNFEGGGNASATMPEAWGWWKMTPELTLGAGYTGTLSNIGYGYDGACNCYYTDNAPVGLNPGDTTQMRLSYASGPLSFAIALEDADSSTEDTLGAAAEIKYAGDSFSAEVSGGWWGDTDAGDDDSWQVGVGVGFSLGDMASISMGAAIGDTGGRQTTSSSTSVANLDYWKASILASANLSDSVHAEIAYGYANWDDGRNNHQDTYTDISGDTHAVLAGIYYDPVSQLTIGLEAEWFQTELSDSVVGNSYNFDQEVMSVDLVTVFRF